MSRRLDVELTSRKDDGSWTWRAAGAREPRGVMDERLLEPLDGSRRVGEVLRVEAEFELEGITVLSVLPPRAKAPEPDRLQLIARPSTGPAVTMTLIGGRSGAERPRGGRGASGRPRRDERAGARPTRGSPSAPATERGTRGPAEHAPGRGGAAGVGLPEREAAGSSAQLRARSRSSRRGLSQGPLASGHAPSGAPVKSRAPSTPSEHGEDRPRRGATTSRAPRPAPFRFLPGRAHLDAALAALPAEQRAVAEQLAQGGLPAVRRALAAERAAARVAGRPELPSDAILSIAEQIRPAIATAQWLDRAEAAEAASGRISLRDLRAVVAAAAPRDEAARALAQRLRESLDERLTKLRAAWEADIDRALGEGRVLQALRLTNRPPEPSTRLPARLVPLLASAASAAMTESTDPERWIALLEAASASPVRRQVDPAGIPEDPTGAVRRAATLQAGRIPSLAKLLGLKMPPPPRPLASGPGAPAPGGRSRPARPAAKRPPVPVPPPAAEPSPEPEPPVAGAPATGLPPSPPAEPTTEPAPAHEARAR